MTTVTARIDEKTGHRLASLAKATERSRSWLINDAIQRYLDVESWQIAAIEEGVQQADAGKFATDAEVRKAFNRWGVNVD